MGYCNRYGMPVISVKGSGLCEGGSCVYCDDWESHMPRCPNCDAYLCVGNKKMCSMCGYVGD